MVSRGLQRISWLQDLREDSDPLLSRYEQELVEDIFYEAESQFNDDTFDPYEGGGETLEKIQILEENLLLIIKRFKLYKDARRDFIRKFPAWQKVRQKSIDALQAIGTSMHADRRNCNISRLVGHCTSLVGGGLLVASVVLIPFTFGLSTPIAVAGGITTGVGSSTSIGTSVTQMVLINKNVNKAKAIIEEDKESFKALKLWLTHANDVTEALNAVSNITSCKNIHEVVETIRNFVNQAREIRNAVQRNRTIERLVEALRQILPQEFERARIIANLAAFFAVIALLNNTEPQIFKDVSKTIIVVTAGLSLLDMSAAAIQPFIKTDAAIFQTIGRNIGQVSATAVARLGVGVIGISLDIASIVLTSIDIHKGSLSEKGNKIINAAETMKEEADILKKVYFELVS